MQGAIGTLGAVLAAERVAEVRVRVLLALGMLVGGEPEHGRALAAVPGAAAALMAAVRAGDDEDCRQVAAGLVAELVRRGLLVLELGLGAPRVSGTRGLPPGGPPGSSRSWCGEVFW